jgi:Fur family ferric uptake transcriptional regulator
MQVDGQALLAIFRRYLHEHSLPVTHQRLAVAEAIFSSGAHLSVEEIAGRVAQQGGPVGTATVYRTVELLVESGLVTENDFGEGFKRYEPGSGEEGRGQPHEHCICSSCGAVTEFSNDRFERMIALLAEEVEFRPHHHRLEIYGLCRRCQQSNPLARAR